MGRLKQIKPRELVKALKQVGFEEYNQRGSHLILVNEERDLQTSVPIHTGDIGRGLLKNILKQVKLTEEEFKELL
ncbi:MAG: hypothetical protein COV33_02240 [Candidatus Zambryskibacteria bacterium CG10_big_fil_rev_8_21_14_0_10_34_34]|uniref:Toxin HicA n=1 Tax=Candidatus Zambryskibacteria bacterium CG10_big_fil_rev_8_21_14_0_10_34_34 TaxID=1975114 RepID=A0A2H0R131_9BACT|nr:MAG: hypothetical protein COV33_02240 [Candidatus Zambryskibacteria bacterium CG10_big_fil_rev_8_21_14_0_10_34_34]